jgi:hypothetical protein
MRGVLEGARRKKRDGRLTPVGAGEKYKLRLVEHVGLVVAGSGDAKAI